MVTMDTNLKKTKLGQKQTLTIRDSSQFTTEKPTGKFHTIYTRNGCHTTSSIQSNSILNCRKY